MKTQDKFQTRRDIKSYVFFALITIAMLLAASCSSDEELCDCTLVMIDDDGVERVAYPDRPCSWADKAPEVDLDGTSSYWKCD